MNLLRPRRSTSKTRRRSPTCEENQQENIVQHPFAFRNFASACKFLHYCRDWTIPDGSRPMFDDELTDIYSSNDKFRLIPLLLQHRRYRSEVTAVNYHFNTISTPPRLHVTYAKNKLITSGDIQRAEELETILKQNIVQEEYNTFFQRITEFMARHMSPKIARILRRNLLPLQKIGFYIQNMLRIWNGSDYSVRRGQGQTWRYLDSCFPLEGKGNNAHGIYFLQDFRSCRTHHS